MVLGRPWTEPSPKAKLMPPVWRLPQPYLQKLLDRGGFTAAKSLEHLSKSACMTVVVMNALFQVAPLEYRLKLSAQNGPRVKWVLVWCSPKSIRSRAGGDSRTEGAEARARAGAWLRRRIAATPGCGRTGRQARAVGGGPRQEGSGRPRARGR